MKPAYLSRWRSRQRLTSQASWVALLLLACKGGEPSISPLSAATEEAATSISSVSEDVGHRGADDASPVGKSFEVDLLLAEVLAARKLEGSIAIYDGEIRRLTCSRQDGCDDPLGPASTYKIPHTLIGFELGELESAEHEFKWDGKQYSVASWNQDHTLRSAMEVSCVPCFQQLARRIGEKRMLSALEKLKYGNMTLGGPIDYFWLEPGGLRISQRQQLEFLYTLKMGDLPFARPAMEATIDVIPKTEGSGYVLRGKTGMILEPVVGWYVGWLERPDGITYFATALRGQNDSGETMKARRAVSVEALRVVTGMNQLE